MAAKKKKKAKSGDSKPGYDLTVAMLKRNPQVDYATIKAAADKKGVTVYPIVFGRAQLALGIVKRSSKKAAKRKAAARKAATRTGAKLTRRGPGRPRKVPATSGLDAIVAQIRDTERERDRAFATLAKIRDLIEQAL